MDCYVLEANTLFPFSWYLCRLVLNPFFGVLLDKNGTRKKKWMWHNTKEHVHAPPFQPITFLITKQLSIRCLSQVRGFKVKWFSEVRNQNLKCFENAQIM